MLAIRQLNKAIRSKRASALQEVKIYLLPMCFALSSFLLRYDLLYSWEKYKYLFHMSNTILRLVKLFLLLCIVAYRTDLKINQGEQYQLSNCKISFQLVKT